MKNLSQLLKFLWIPLLVAAVFSCSDDEVVVKPTITAVSPDKTLPGTIVTITGTNLKNISSVKFGTVEAEGFDASANTATTVTATVPAGAVAGEQEIFLASPGGTATITFTVLEAGEPEPVAPTITGISPLKGPAGSEVVMSGTGLAATTKVMFGTVSITGFTTTSGDITFTVPANATPGDVTITATTPGGEASIGFTVSEPEPVITSFSTTSRVIGGKVTINGTNLDLVTYMRLGEIEILPENFSSNIEGTKLIFVVPEGAVTSNVILITENGTEFVSIETLHVPSPPPFTFSPNSGPEGTIVTVSGSGFTGTTSLMLGEMTITPVSVAEDGNSLTFTVPEGAASGKITIGTLVHPIKFFILEEGLVADFDTNAMLKWPQNGVINWGWGIPNENITTTAEGISPIDGYFALIKTDIAPEGAYANEKVVNLVDYLNGEQIFPTAPKATYDPSAPIGSFVATMDIAVAQPTSLQGMELQISTYNADGVLLSAYVDLANVVTTTDGTWYNVSIPLSALARNTTTLSTYGDLLAGGIEAGETGIFTNHFRVSVNNKNAADTEAIPATIAIDNIKIVRAQ